MKLNFDVDAPSISDQLAARGIALSREIVAGLQRDADMLLSLHARAMLSDAEVSSARERLMRRILRLSRTAQRSE